MKNVKILAFDLFIYYVFFTEVNYNNYLYE